MIVTGLRIYWLSIKSNFRPQNKYAIQQMQTHLHNKALIGCYEPVGPLRIEIFGLKFVNRLVCIDNVYRGRDGKYQLNMKNCSINDSFSQNLPSHTKHEVLLLSLF